jgi:Flp pilus assembly pilin Flp
MMANLAKTAWKRIRQLDRDERGADMVEYILLVAVIALPLLAVIIYYRDKIRDILADMFGDIESSTELDPN